MAYLHGVEVRETATGPRPVRSVSTGVIGLVGTAPIGVVAAEDRRVNVPVLITSDVDARRYFGDVTNGFTIPAALKAIFDQGAGAVVVVNVFDPAVHMTATSGLRQVGPGHIVELGHKGVTNLVVKSAGGDTFGLGTDYSADLATGKITFIDLGNAPDIGDDVQVTYQRQNPVLVTPSQVIGGVSAGGQRTGMQAWRDAASTFGVTPKLLIAPAWDTQASIVAELLVLAERLRAMALWDAPAGTTFDAAIAGRGPAGSINLGSSSGRGIACFPHVRVLDAASGEVVLAPYAPRLAGVIAARDESEGYHVSPSNTEIRGIVGAERPLTADIRDSGSEVNRLNEVGITTIYHGFGTGFRVWGNRTTAWPSDTHPLNFVPVRRTADALYDALELLVLPYLGRPYSAALLDIVRESMNAYLRGLVAEGRLIAGSCTFDPAKNDATSVAAGQITYDITFMPPTVAERFTISAVVDTSLLGALAPTN